MDWPNSVTHTDYSNTHMPTYIQCLWWDAHIITYIIYTNKHVHTLTPYVQWLFIEYGSTHVYPFPVCTYVHECVHMCVHVCVCACVFWTDTVFSSPTLFLTSSPESLHYLSPNSPYPLSLSLGSALGSLGTAGGLGLPRAVLSDLVLPVRPGETGRRPTPGQRYLWRDFGSGSRLQGCDVFYFMFRCIFGHATLTSVSYGNVCLYGGVVRSSSHPPLSWLRPSAAF